MVPVPAVPCRKIACEAHGCSVDAAQHESRGTIYVNAENVFVHRFKGPNGNGYGKHADAARER
jgi:hypothetical protein